MIIIINIKVIFKDYRDLNGSFDKLVSIEMIEAVGHNFTYSTSNIKNYIHTCILKLITALCFLP